MLCFSLTKFETCQLWGRLKGTGFSVPFNLLLILKIFMLTEFVFMNKFY